jgi:hypothetical protein
VLEDVQPLLRDARAAQPWLRQAGTRLDRLTRNAAPPVTDLRAARVGRRRPGHDFSRRRSAPRGHRPGDAVGAAVPELLSLQRQTLGILQQSLAIQRSTERHAASLDRKTGGTVPVAAPAPALLP